MTDTTPTLQAPSSIPRYQAKSDYRDFGVHPELAKMLRDLSVTYPTATFFGTERGFMFGGDPNARCVTRAEVIINSEEVGSVLIGTRWNSSEMKNDMVYVIKSDRIKSKKRSNAGTKTTKDYAIALKTAKTAFTPPETSVIAMKIRGTVTHEMDKLLSRASSAFEWSARGSLPEIATYITDVHRNGPKSLPASIVTALFDKNKLDQKADTLRIVQSVSAQCKGNTGYAVRLTSDGKYVAVDLSTNEVALTTTSTFDFPVEYQEKLAILKLMEPAQAVEGIGVRTIESDTLYFYLAPGATPTA